MEIRKEIGDEQATARCDPAVALGRYQARYRDQGAGRLVAGRLTFERKADAARWLATIEADLAASGVEALYVPRRAVSRPSCLLNVQRKEDSRG